MRGRPLSSVGNKTCQTCCSNILQVQLACSPFEWCSNFCAPSLHRKYIHHASGRWTKLHGWFIGILTIYSSILYTMPYMNLKHMTSSSVKFGDWTLIFRPDTVREVHVACEAKSKWTRVLSENRHSSKTAFLEKTWWLANGFVGALLSNKATNASFFFMCFFTAAWVQIVSIYSGWIRITNLESRPVLYTLR